MNYVHALLSEHFPGVPWARIFPMTEFDFANPKAGYFYWANLLAYALAALLLFWMHRRSGQGSKTLVQFLFPREIYKTAVFRLEATNYIVLGVFGFFLSGAVLALQTEGIQQGFAWFHHRLHAASREQPLFAWQHEVLLTLCIFVSREFFVYWQHRMMHANPYLWEFHKVHHTSTALTIFSGARVHPVDSILVGAFAVVGAGVATIPFVAVFGEQVTPFTIVGINAISYALRIVLVMNAHHSHLWLAWGPHLGRIFISPAYHQLHHSRDPRHFGKNLSAWIAAFDWLFGTQCVPGKYEEISYGVSDEEDRHYTTLQALYVRPFVQCARAVLQVAPADGDGPRRQDSGSA